MKAKRQVAESRCLPIALAVGMFAALGCTAVLEAGEVEVTFGGVVIELDPAPPEEWPWGDVGVGDSWSVTYVFETTTGDSNPWPYYGFYIEAVTSATLTIHGVSVDTLVYSEIGVANNLPTGQQEGCDHYGVFIVFDPVPPLNTHVDFAMELWDGTGSALSADALPLCYDIQQLPLYAPWRTVRVEYGSAHLIRGSVDSFVCGPHETEMDCNENGTPDAEEWVSTHTFCIEPCPQDCSDGTEWSLEVRFPLGGPVFAQANCPPVPPEGSTEVEMAEGLVDCINATICSGMRATLYPGYPCFTINAPGQDPVELCVGPAGVPADCCIESDPYTGSPRPVCPFNPTLAHVEVVNEDCNENQVEDGIDIALETSEDNNEDGIPDECGACCSSGPCRHTLPGSCAEGLYRGDATNCELQDCDGIPAVSEWGMAVMVLLMLTAGTVVLLRRRVVRA